ncbi:hypothetical protein ANN_02724 [Periplaneta americana]|uniref:Uncharacterized protein n=1 Tax=Periplaneta americana TaxID=6978 RepID=A0ABQ8TZJ8_PERAM|nr:hypothetical protein ANN_02724 [Periplaneta americana]
MSPGSSTESYPAFARIGLRENPGKNLNQTFDMGRACSTYVRIRNAYSVLLGRPERKRPLGRPRRRWKDHIKMDLRKVEYDALSLLVNSSSREVHALKRGGFLADASKIKFSSQRPDRLRCCYETRPKLCSGGDHSVKALRPLAEQVLNVNRRRQHATESPYSLKENKNNVLTLQGSVLVIIDPITSVAVNDDIFSLCYSKLRNLSTRIKCYFENDERDSKRTRMTRRDETRRDETRLERQMQRTQRARAAKSMARPRRKDGGYKNTQEDPELQSERKNKYWKIKKKKIIMKGPVRLNGSEEEKEEEDGF